MPRAVQDRSRFSKVRFHQKERSDSREAFGLRFGFGLMMFFVLFAVLCADTSFAWFPSLRPRMKWILMGSLKDCEWILLYLQHGIHFQLQVQFTTFAAHFFIPSLVLAHFSSIYASSRYILMSISWPVIMRNPKAVRGSCREMESWEKGSLRCASTYQCLI